MSKYLGDFATGATIYFYFESYNAAGASVTLTGLAVTDIEVYKNGSTTQRSSDAGYTLLDTDGIDFDGVTGIHGFSIDTSDNTDAGFYVAGADYTVVVSAVTIDSQTVTFIAGRFSIENRNTKANVTQWLGTAAATPTTAGVPSVDVITWLGSTPLALSSQRLQVLVGSIGTNIVNAAALATDAVTEIAAGVWNAVRASYATAGTFGEGAASVQGNVTGSVGSVTGAVGSVTGNVGGNVTGSVGSVTGSVGSVTGNVGGNVAGTVASVVGNVGGNVTGSVGSVASGGITSATFAANALDAVWSTAVRTLTANTNLNDPTAAAIATAVWTTALTESYNADGVAPTPAQALFLALQMLTHFSISGTTLTVYKLDGSTTAATFTLNDATSPTSITRTS